MMVDDSRRGNPFAPMHLTPDQQQHCQDIMFQLLDRTLRSYDERNDSRDAYSGSPRHHANLDCTQWKQLKTQTNASLYSKRTSAAQQDLHLPRDNWNSPSVLLAVGTIADSTIDEVMFGLETPNFLSLQMRSEVLGKQPLDGAVLAQLAEPSEGNPFTWMGVTWMVGEHSWPLSMVVRPRDFIIVSATGTVNRPNGEMIGYEVVQSIDLPQCPPLPAPMVRGKLMYGAIYCQRDHGAVDVYVQMYVETYGRLLDKIVVAAMWESTLGFWKAPQLSEMKKLQWCMNNKSVKRQEQALALACTHMDLESRHCNVCLRKRSSQARRVSVPLRDNKSCALCSTSLCWNCRVKRKIKVRGDRGAKLVDVEVSMCQACMSFVKKQCPAKIASDNQKQRQATDDSSRSASQRMTLESIWDQPTLSQLGLAARYPSISMSDLVKLINPGT
ncbi:unnamed protein product [Phytophthora fragariaefolia]|uniref:Unnamed protein product n=1 Tax=Phytophthora fragariaefolia TaxID=1490495 RepID=A0A9W6TN16_9STRA|nr:unnamed protein product [Phytophthora fragariaefolia]